MNRLFLNIFFISFIITLFIAFLTCISPIRWDMKSYVTAFPETDYKNLEYGKDVLFISADDGWQNNHIAAYGLDLITFPHGKNAWLLFKEGMVNDNRNAVFLIDKAGNFYRRTVFNSFKKTKKTPEKVKALVKSGIIIVPTQKTKDAFIQRWPLISTGKIIVLKGKKASFLEYPSLRINLNQMLRIFVLVLISSSIMAFAWGITGNTALRCLRWFNFALGFPCLLIFHTIIVFCLGKITQAAINWAIAFELFISIALLLFLNKKFAISMGSVKNKNLHLLLPIMVAGLIYIFFIVLKLDFDGDIYTHWLTMGRFHHKLSHHDPVILFERYGLQHEVVYPPAFAILISTLMWAGDMAKNESFQINYTTHLVIFLYRLFFAVLYLLFLFALCNLFVKVKQERDWLTGLLPIVLIMLLLPMFLGLPTSAEIYFVTMAGFSMLAFLASDELQNQVYSRIGLLLGVVLMFIKIEGILIFPFIIIPWYLTCKCSNRKWSIHEMAGDIIILFIGLIPFFVWKSDLYNLRITEGISSLHFEFSNVTLEKLTSNIPLLIQLFENAIKIFLANNYWMVFFLILPIATLYNWLWKRKIYNLIIPFGIYIYLTGVTSIYVFSTSPTLAHMNTSFSRILMIAVLSAIIYGMQTLMLLKNRAAPANHTGKEFIVK